MILGKKGIDVPQNCINYEDKNIDYSDIAHSSFKDTQDKQKIFYTTNIAIPKEIKATEKLINLRPRKRFQYKNPEQEMDWILFNNNVAFVT